VWEKKQPPEIKINQNLIEKSSCFGGELPFISISPVQGFTTFDIPFSSNQLEWIRDLTGGSGDF